MIAKLLLGFLLLFPSSLFAQATWNGYSYSHRVCNNPGCMMCNSIERQLSRTVYAPSYAISAPATATTIEYRTVTRQVKRCNGRVCWYETVTEQIPVSVPVAATSSSLLAVTELVPTPMPVVSRMLELLNPRGTLYDLGSGDGRILIAAAQDYEVHATGIELNKNSVLLARRAADSTFVGKKVTIIHGDILKQDLSSAEYVTMYLYTDLMKQIVPRLRKGTRIVSYQHPIPDIECTSHLIELDGAFQTIYMGTK